ncbi:GTP cyclohydrolase I [Glutamicibacter soli]|uniref:GTP cyclohydrolase I n=1 Tax=Glutamicibacter soli TaxID=453836 RepID=UPI003C78A146
MNPLDQLGEALAEVEELDGQAPGLPARVLSPQQAGEMDLAAAEHAAGEFLRALGMDLGAVHLQRTPARMAQAWAQMLTPRDFTFTTFPNEEHYDQLVVLRDNPVRPVCGHHLLPFTGRAGVGYLPDERSVGLSKLARIVEHFACRPRTPGTADPADRRLAAQGAEPAGGRSGDFRRAFVHEPARGQHPGHQHGDLRPARAPAGQPRRTPGIPVLLRPDEQLRFRLDSALPGLYA